MTKKYYLINLFLILLIVFLMEKNYREWTSPLSARQETARLKQKTKLPVSSSTAGKKEMPASAVFQSISNKNIFSPDRGLSSLSVHGSTSTPRQDDWERQRIAHSIRSSFCGTRKSKGCSRSNGGILTLPGICRRAERDGRENLVGWVGWAGERIHLPL